MLLQQGAGGFREGGSGPGMLGLMACVGSIPKLVHKRPCEDSCPAAPSILASSRSFNSGHCLALAGASTCWRTSGMCRMTTSRAQASAGQMRHHVML